MNGIFKTLISVIFLGLSYSSIAQPQEYVTNFQRASVTQIMIEHPMYPFNEEMVTAFKEIPLPTRFNNHDLGIKIVRFATPEYTDQTNYIKSFLTQAKVANRAVARWFNWNKETGIFNMQTIKERGFYNSTSLDRVLSQHLIRGNAILTDAGENLISDTYIIMHDVCFKGNYSNKGHIMYQKGIGGSFNVEITSYIFRLEWNSDILYEFYSNHFNTQNLNFIKQANYNYTYCAKATTSYKYSSSKLSQSDIIKVAMVRCLDQNIAKLQKEYNPFRLKAMVSDVTPFKADIGTKEGIDSNSIFEVLEATENSDGIISYKRIGKVKPKDGRIADNVFRIDNDISNTNECLTEFEIIEGSNFYPGLLIREI